MDLATAKIVNVATVPLRSPFRYAGGKTWLVPQARLWLKSFDPCPRELIEPFAGGAVIGLTAGFEELAGHVTLVELDADVGAVWQVILGEDGPRLAGSIVDFHMSLDNVKAILGREPRSTFDRAFATVLKNRTYRGGILAPGASLIKHGENGRGLKSRWYPLTLYRRTMEIVAIKDRFTFVPGNGLEVLRQNEHREDAVYFIDPPYTVAGRRLYAHNEIDHTELFKIVGRLAGDFLMTYDDAREIRDLAAKHGFAVQEVAMKSTHHERKVELLIGRDLSWARAG